MPDIDEAEDMFLKAAEARAMAAAATRMGLPDAAAKFHKTAEQFDEWGHEAQRALT